MTNLIGSHYDTLSGLGVDMKELKNYSVLLLPENIESKKETDEFQDASGSVLMYKLLRAEGVKCANSKDIGIDSYLFERRGGDIWLGTIWILENLIFPIVSSIIVYKILESRGQKDENCQVHLDIRFPNGDHIKYDGNTKKLYSLLHSLENETTDEGFHDE